MIARLSANAALALLVLLTVGAFIAFEFGRGSLFAGIAVFVIALAKVQVIVADFMHLRWSHRPFRQVITAWSTIVLAILCGGLLLLPWI